MTRSTLALLVTGALCIVAGVAMVHVPAALVVAGVALLAAGLNRDVKPERDGKVSRP